MLKPVYKRIPSPLGELIAIQHEGKLTGLYFTDQSELGVAWVDEKNVLRPDSPLLRGVIESQNDPLLCRLSDDIGAYFKGQAVTFDFPLQAKGTLFQQEVWTALKLVPYGRTLSYGSLAQAIQRPKAVRAVGQAVGANPWVIVVPCHRVLAAKSKLGGFSSGIERKKALLKLEGLFETVSF